MPHHFRSAGLVVRQRSHISLSMWPERRRPAELSHLEQYTRTPGSLHITFECGLQTHWAADFVHHMPLSNVESMLISEPTVETVFGPSGIPIHTLGELPSLTELVLEYESFDDVKDTSLVHPAAKVFNGPMKIQNLPPG